MWFKKTREINTKLYFIQKELEDLRETLRMHFDFKCTLSDFSKHVEENPGLKNIKLTPAEIYNYNKMIPDWSGTAAKIRPDLHYRGIKIIKQGD